VFDTLDPIFSAIRQAGGRPLVVGGYVRDLILGVQSKDVDVEVYGLGLTRLVEVLSQFGKVDAVGASFGVLKVHGYDVDWSLPRTESKSGRGHKGFLVSTDPWMSIEDAAARRDFTFNALLMDPEDGTIIDPFNGCNDLDRSVLRHTSEHFGDDPLRVLRGFQFCGRFDLVAAHETVEVCRSLRPEAYTLARERVWDEWYKWASRSVNPVAGLVFLRVTGWLYLYPELAALLGVEQDETWHPEGSAWRHTCLAVEAANRIATREGLYAEDRAVLVFAALLHDVGKAVTTTVKDGRIVSPGHAEAGAPLAAQFLGRIGAPAWLIARVVPLVSEHLAHLNTVTPRSVRRLARRLTPATVHELGWVIEADHSARFPLPAGMPGEAVAMLDMAAVLDLGDAAPAPILMGRHLLDVGWHPGPEMGQALRAAFEAQLDGEFDSVEGGLFWLDNNF
jgi:tRNA nucleotidyltransferase (CCA-adding enzyme)